MNYIDIMIIKRFSLHRKDVNLAIFVISLVKTKIFETLFGIYIPALVISFSVHNNLIQKVWVNLINGRQHKTQCFLGKISESHRISLSRGHRVLRKNYNYLNPTKLLDLYYSFVQFIPSDCGLLRQYNTVIILESSLSFTEEKISQIVLLTFYVLQQVDNTEAYLGPSRNLRLSFL